MLVPADSAFTFTFALVMTFIVGIGALVNGLIFYIIAQVMAERKQNQERRQRQR
jgi:hypothetical protein